MDNRRRADDVKCIAHVYKAEQWSSEGVVFLDSTMKAVLLFVCVSLFVAAVIGADTYPTNWDNVNIDEILSNTRLLDQYVNCVLDDNAKCTPEGAALKSKYNSHLCILPITANIHIETYTHTSF